MSKLFVENPPKIYLKDSDKVRLADCRVRIVKENNPLEPCDNEDLVFEKAEDESLIPANALHKWKFDCNNEHEPIWFFTTVERCVKLVSDNPFYWTFPKLIEFEKSERKLYQNWWDGHVYGYVIEKWVEKQRKWIHISSLWGMYGADSLMTCLFEDTDGFSIPICIDDEEMKYEFENTEKKVNEFSEI